MEKVILLDHGSGGRATHWLIREIFQEAFGGPKISLDAALLERLSEQIALTTDGFVVDPIFFPGGDIGTLAVYGTVNDLAMVGAKPLYLACGFILEEGFPLNELRQVVQSMSQAAYHCGVQIVCGDTKVVPKGKGDRIYITTTGVGVLLREPAPHPKRISPEDEILISGYIGEHGLAVLASRENLPIFGFKSDSAPVWKEVKALLDALGPALHALRDPTRGGLATALNELAEDAEVSFVIEEEALPISPVVRSGCEILGLDPLYLACEGCFIAVVEAGAGRRALEVLQAFPQTRMTRLIGKVIEKNENPPVILRTHIGGQRVLPMLSGEPLPRIC